MTLLLNSFDRDRNQSTILADHYIRECETLEKYLESDKYKFEIDFDKNTYRSKSINGAIERPFAASLSCLKRSTVGLWNEPDSFLYIEGKSYPCA